MNQTNTMPAYIDDDEDACSRCGEPLAADRWCDCAGTELDASLPLNHPSEKRMRVLTTFGLKATYQEQGDAR